jgi:uncharacterized membrane protein
MAQYYLFFEWLHIIGATILFGTGVGIAFNFWLAVRTTSVAVIAAAARATVFADFVFSLPAVVLQPITGVALIYGAGFPIQSRWIVYSTLLYVVAGACWIPVVFMQIRMRDLAVKCLADGTPLPEEFHRLARRWFVLGWPAFLAVAWIFWLMVARPE